MFKESKKILAVVFLMTSFSFSFAYADSAFIPGGYWDQLLQQGGLFGNLASSGGIFGSGGTVDRLIPNCTSRSEYNPYTRQYTQNEICDPKVASYTTSGSGNFYSQTAYPTDYAYYVQPAVNYVTYQQPAYVYDYAPTTYYITSSGYNDPYGQYNQSAIAAYSGSNIWYPCDRSGYCNEGLFNTYYRGGRGDVSGFYDSPNLCFDGGPNCGGYPEYGDIDPYVYDQGSYNGNPYVTMADTNTNNMVTYCADCDAYELQNMGYGGLGY